MSIKQAIEALEVAQDALDISQSLQESAKSNHHPKTLAAYERVSAALAALRSMPQGEPVATIRYERGTPGKENDMPKVVSCNWLPDGVYSVYATPHTEAVQDDCDTVDRLLKGLGLDPERCRTEGGALNVGRTLSLLQDGCTNRCPTADLESAAMEMYERSGGKDWMREPETEKWRAIANIGFKWAKRAEAVRMSEEEPTALFLLHAGKIGGDGEQDEWDVEADSGARVDAFCKLYPGQTIKLYPGPPPTTAFTDGRACEDGGCMSDKLLPCPFCGGKAQQIKKRLDERFAYAEEVSCGCVACGYSLSAVGDTSKPGYADNSTVEARAVAKWNRRAAASIGPTP